MTILKLLIVVYNDNIVYMITSTYTYVFPVFSHLTRQHSCTLTLQCTFLRNPLPSCHPFNMPPEIFCKDASCFCIPANGVQLCGKLAVTSASKNAYNMLPVSNPTKNNTLSNKKVQRICKSKKHDITFCFFYQLSSLKKCGYFSCHL